MLNVVEVVTAFCKNGFKGFVVVNALKSYICLSLMPVNNSFHGIYRNNFADNTLFVMTDKAVAFKGCIESVEAYRPQGLFSDAVKGLNTFGCKVVRPKELVLIKTA
jgi:hypothetical protein